MQGRFDAAGKIVCMLCPGGFEHAGGIGRWAEYLFAHWPEPPAAPPMRMLDTRGFGGTRVAAFAFVRTLAQLLWLRMSGRLGLVHINLSVRGSTVRKSVVSTMAWYMGVPVIIHLHSGRYPEFYRSLPGWGQSIVRRIFARAERAIVLGKVWEDFVVSKFGVARDKIVILPNAVPSPPPRAPRPEGSPCHIVMLGRLGPPKGLPELIQALGGDVMRPLSWRATLAGDGDAETYRRMAQGLGIGERVDFPGWLDSAGVARLMQSADVLVLPSRSENLPVAVVEALSYGLPVVTTPVGATPEFVTDEESGLIVPVQDPAALAVALSRLTESAVLRERLGQAGYQVFAARLDIRGAAQTLIALYSDVLKSRPLTTANR